MPETDITILTRPIDPSLYRRGRGYVILYYTSLPTEPEPSAPYFLPHPASIGYTSYVVLDIQVVPFIDTTVLNTSASTTTPYQASAPYGAAPALPFKLPLPAPVAYTSYVIMDIETSPFMDLSIVNTSASTAATYGLTVQD